MQNLFYLLPFFHAQMKDCIAVRVKLTDAHITLPRKQRKTANALYFLFRKRKVMLQCLV